MATSSASLVGSPISKLPPEILIQIFVVVIVGRGQKSSDRFRSGQRGLPSSFLLTHVCQHWKEVVLNCPMLWTRIEFPSSRCSAEMIARSRGAPLKFAAAMDGLWPQRYRATSSKDVQVALQHVSHIQELDLTHKSQDLTNLLRTMTSPALVLECLSLRVSKPGLALEGLTESTFAGVAPKLRSLVLARCNFANWDVPILENIVNFSFYDVSIRRRPYIEDYLAMLKGMPNLERLFVVNAFAWLPQELISEGELILLSDRPILTMPHLSRLSLKALEPAAVNPWDITFILAHLSLPALCHIDITVDMGGYLYDLQCLLPILVHHCHGPQDNAPIRAVAIAGLDWLSSRENGYVAVTGWTDSMSTNVGDTRLSQLFNDHRVESDDSRFCFCFEKANDDNNSRNLAATLSAFPLSHVLLLAVDSIIGDFHRASWWTDTHVLFPSLDRLYIKGSEAFRTFCYAFVTNKTAPAMNLDKGTPLAAHRFMKHPEKRKEFFDVPSTLQELIFPGLRTLTMVDVGFEMKEFADLFIEALVARRELGVGIQMMEITRGRFDMAYVERLREVVPVVDWEGKETDMEDVEDYRWLDVDSDGGEVKEDESEIMDRDENGV